MINMCADCGSRRFEAFKLVILRGQPWLLRIDEYRFYIRPAEGNPLIDREEHPLLAFKHDNSPARELAELMFAHLPDSSGAERG